MSSRKLAALFLAAALPLGLPACGFEPIAAPADPAAGPEAIRIAALQTSGQDALFDYHLRRALLKRVVVDETAPVRINVASSLATVGLNIQQNDTVTRYNLRSISRYSLIDGVEDVATAGDITTTTSFNATTDQFTTRISEEEARERLAVETATRLVNVLMIENAKPDSRL